MKHCTVLVVEDDPAIRFNVAETLDMEGYQVITATNGAEGLVHVGEQSIDVVLLDMRMPVLDGWGFMRALRDRGLSLKVVVMTAAADAYRWAQEVEATGHLSKPFNLDALIAEVQRHCPLDTAA